MGPNSKKEKQVMLIDRKRAFAEKEEDTYNRIMERLFKEDGKQSVKKGGLLKTV